jgi:hypothetical protein
MAAAIMMLNRVVWKHRVTHVALVWMIVTGLFLAWLSAGMTWIGYPG